MIWISRNHWETMDLLVIEIDSQQRDNQQRDSQQIDNHYHWIRTNRWNSIIRQMVILGKWEIV